MEPSDIIDYAVIFFAIITAIFFIIMALAGLTVLWGWAFHIEHVHDYVRIFFASLGSVIIFFFITGFFVHLSE